MLFILGIIIALGLLIIIHELGHFLAARAFGVTVEKFSCGFGPKIIGKKKGPTEFKLSAIPLGGFVKMKGDEPQKDTPFEKDEFYGQRWWKRVLIVFAGPFANLILGAVLFISSFMIGRIIEDHLPVIGNVTEEKQAYFQTGDEIIAVNNEPVKSWSEIIRLTRRSAEDEFIIEREGVQISKTIDSIEPQHWTEAILPDVPPVIGTVAPGMPAYRSGLQEGDKILEVEGEPVADWYEMRKLITEHPDDQAELTIDRDGDIFKVTVPLEASLIDDTGQKMIGVTQKMPKRYFERYGFLESFNYGLFSTGSFIILNYRALFRILTDPFLARDHIGGPVMIVTLSRQTAEMGFGAVVAFVASISLILMIMNLLPIPVLDGGHIMFFFIEAIFRKPLSYKAQVIIQQVGFMFIILLMLFAFYNDIARLAKRSATMRNQQVEEPVEQIPE